MLETTGGKNDEEKGVEVEEHFMNESFKNSTQISSPVETFMGKFP